jgi:hypothetical protein
MHQNCAVHTLPNFFTWMLITIITKYSYGPYPEPVLFQSTLSCSISVQQSQAARLIAEDCHLCVSPCFLNGNFSVWTGMDSFYTFGNCLRVNRGPLLYSFIPQYGRSRTEKSIEINTLCLGIVLQDTRHCTMEEKWHVCLKVMFHPE